MTKQITNVVEDLKWRGALADSTPGAEDLLINDKITCYNGFDPTSDTLHIGNLLPLMCLARLQRYGHTPIAILGGGTGMIGDPSGRTDERSLLSIEEIDANGEKIRVQLEQFLDFDTKIQPRETHQQCRLAQIDQLPRLPPRHRQKLHRQHHDPSRFRPIPHGTRRRRHLIH